MLATIHQPAYLPWLPYLDKLAQAELFVFMDSVQFTKNEQINRNLIKAPGGELQWLTIPVRLEQHFERTIADTEIADGGRWARKHLQAIRCAYARAPRFGTLFPMLEALYERSAGEPLVAEVCLEHLRFWMAEFGIETPIVRSSELPVTGTGSDLVLSICEAVGADAYLSGPMGRDYLDAEAFAAAGIDLRFHAYELAPYPQLHGDFVPRLGVVDLAMQSNDFEWLAAACGRTVPRCR